MDSIQTFKEHKIQLFSTPVWGFILSKESYHAEDYLNEIKELAETEPSVKKSNMGGFQTQDNLHKNGVFRELCDNLENYASVILKEYDIYTKPKISEMWGNINRYKDFNASHVHSGVLSGVFYLQTPENCGNLILITPTVRADASFIREKNYVIKPQNLACIIFPSWLEHYVEPNLSQEERISLSFNFIIPNE